MALPIVNQDTPYGQYWEWRFETELISPGALRVLVPNGTVLELDTYNTSFQSFRYKIQAIATFQVDPLNLGTNPLAYSQVWHNVGYSGTNWVTPRPTFNTPGYLDDWIHIKNTQVPPERVSVIGETCPPVAFWWDAISYAASQAFGSSGFLYTNIFLEGFY
jgi:hypothetical protein